MLLILIPLALLIFLAPWYFVFEKAGVPGWKGVIPFYNWYCLLILTNNQNKRLYYLPILAPLVILCQNFFTHFAAGSLFTQSVLPYLCFAFHMASLGVMVMGYSDFAKCFKRTSFGFTLGLTCLNPLFMLILAFSKTPFEPLTRLTKQGSNESLAAH